VEAGNSTDRRFSEIFMARKIVETDRDYLGVVSTANPLKSRIVTVSKHNGRVSTVGLGDMYVTAMEQDMDRDFLLCAQKKMGADPEATIVLVSPTGERIREYPLPGAVVSEALAVVDDGFVFGYEDANGMPVLASWSWDGAVVWERRFSDELDPGKDEQEHIDPRTIARIRKDADGSLVVAQTIVKTGSAESEPRDAGYAVYKVSATGELAWAAANYRGRTEWGDAVWARDIALLPDGTMALLWYLGTAEPGGSTYIISYLDNTGGFIHDLATFGRQGEGAMCFSSDHQVIYVNREHDVPNSVLRSAMYKYDLDGTILWRKTLYSVTSGAGDVPIPLHVHLCNDGTFLFSSYQFTDVPGVVRLTFLRVDANGNRLNDPQF